MSNFKKVVLAIEDARNFFMDQGYAPEFFDTIIAELEKPAENANLCAASLWDIEFPFTSHGWVSAASGIIQQYAESYHAKLEEEAIKRAIWLYRETCGGCGEKCVGECVHIRQLNAAITGIPV